MAVLKILLDDDFGDDFSLIAIHCSEEAYKMAYSINKHLNLRLRRMSTDLEFSEDQGKMSFPIFEFEDQFQYTTYYLVSNKCKINVRQQGNPGGLFGGAISERVVTKNLLPEFKNADFFLKIETDFDRVPLRKNLALINDIEEVISAYEIEPNQIKSNSNLIFN